MAERTVRAASTKAPSTPTARERLLAAANELFYAEGVHTVGIDRVIERAGVAKASLYNSFGSKDELVRAYLESRHQRTADRITRHLARYADPRDRLLSVFEAQGELFAEPGFRGCAFARASAESPGELVEQATGDYRRWVHGLLTDLAAQAGAAAPDELGRQLHLLYDGAFLAARMDPDPAVAVSARAAAEILLDAALAADAHPGQLSWPESPCSRSDWQVRPADGFANVCARTGARASGRDLPPGRQGDHPRRYLHGAAG